MEAACDGSRRGPLGCHTNILPTGGPADRADICPQHPKSRPHADSCRQLGAPFNPPIGYGVKVPGLHAGGSIAESVGGFLPRHDVQDAIADVSVVCATSVILQFSVTPATVVAGLERPLAGINGSAIEFVTPNDVPLSDGRNYHRAAGLVQRKVIEIHRAVCAIWICAIRSLH